MLQKICHRRRAYVHTVVQRKNNKIPRLIASTLNILKSEEQAMVGKLTKYSIDQLTNSD